ncbi:MAG: 30S ribosomal protein S13 [Gammaproteobacteria bacterium]|jgi:small subunit ribosomal protein S13|nr:30S ribosomal protein S13 [Gammaproteobacteria bacterium]
MASNTIVAGRVLHPKKHIWVALSGAIYGIGKSRAMKICKNANVESSTRVGDLSDEQLDLIRTSVTSYTIEGDLRREVRLNIKSLMDKGCYRGKRHRRGLPVRGQRTKTNARTRKGRTGSNKG